MCWPRALWPATSGMTSCLTNLRATASMPSQQPATCRIRLRSAGSSQSPWRGCAPRAESFKEGDLLVWAGGWLCRLRVSRLGAREETTATVAPHQGSYDERPQGHENYGHQPGDRVE